MRIHDNNYYCVQCLYTNCVISVPWTPVNKTQIGSDYLTTATTLSYSIPSIIPSTAREVLVYTTMWCGWNRVTVDADITYFVEVNGIRYEHFLHVYAYRQSAINTNSDNMWFPMPPNRMVYIDVPLAFSSNYRTLVSVIGYR